MFSRRADITKGLGGLYNSFHAVNKPKPSSSKENDMFSTAVAQPVIFTPNVKQNKRKKPTRMFIKSKKAAKQSSGSKKSRKKSPGRKKVKKTGKKRVSVLGDRF